MSRPRATRSCPQRPTARPTPTRPRRSSPGARRSGPDRAVRAFFPADRIDASTVAEGARRPGQAEPRLARGAAGVWWPIRSSKPAGRSSPPAFGWFDSIAAPWARGGRTPERSSSGRRGPVRRGRHADGERRGARLSIGGGRCRRPRRRDTVTNPPTPRGWPTGSPNHGREEPANPQRPAVEAPRHRPEAPKCRMCSRRPGRCFASSHSLEASLTGSPITVYRSAPRSPCCRPPPARRHADADVDSSRLDAVAGARRAVRQGRMSPGWRRTEHASAASPSNLSTHPPSSPTTPRRR